MVDEITSLRTIISFITGQDIPIFDGKGIGRVGIEVIILPSEISLSENLEINRLLYIHKALVSGVIIKDKIFDPKTIIERLSFIFPKFIELHEYLIHQLSETPNFMSMLWVECSLGSFLQSTEKQEISGQDLEKKMPSGSELEGETSTESIEEVSLQKIIKEENPVLHSFEKLETADEYHGGSRVTDADDELQDHSNALKELNLKHVTREGEGAGSLYKASLSELFGLNIFHQPTPRFEKYKKMPEWNFRNKEFLLEYCRLYILEDSLGGSPPNASAFIEFLNEKYGEEISLWKNKIFSIANQFGWRDRQLDGVELVIDAYTKYFSDLKASGQGDTKIFKRALPIRKDFTTTILVDLSLSSDAWIENRRVLDVEVESIGLCGLLLHEIHKSLSILGTWSETRHHCYLQVIKDFHSPWNHYYESARQISSRGYTRLGPAMRFAKSELVKTKAKNKLLILMTDGKPTDLDKYEGRYGIEDMRHAILEAEREGIHVHALAIDSTARHYFPQMFHSNRYQILSDPKKLPEQLFKILMTSI